MDEKKLAFWQEIIVKQQDSGLSVRKYCEENNLKKSRYYYWQDKINKLASTNNTQIFAKIEKPKEYVQIKKDKKVILNIAFKDLTISISSKEHIALTVELIKQLQQIC